MRNLLAPFIWLILATGQLSHNLLRALGWRKRWHYSAGEAFDDGLLIWLALALIVGTLIVGIILIWTI